MNRKFFKNYRLTLYGLIWVSITLTPRIGLSEGDDGWFDIAGLYHYSYPDINNHIINSYLVISRNNEQYMAISLSKDLHFLRALLLVNNSEVVEKSISPSLEEFAISFTATREEIIQVRKFNIKPVIPFPNRTTEMKWVEADRWIGIGPPLDGELFACVSTEMEIVFHPIICYKKIF